MGRGAALLLGATVWLYCWGQDAGTASDPGALAIDARKHADAAEELRKKGDAASLKQAITEFQKAAELWISANEETSAAAALDRAGRLLYMQGDYASARERCQRAVDIYRGLKNDRGTAAALYDLARVLLATGETPKAIEDSEEALAIRRALGDKADEGSILQNLGWAYFMVGDTQKSFTAYKDALAIREEVKDDLGIGLAQYGLGSVYWAWGDSEKALKEYEAAIAAYRTAKYERGVADTLNSAGLAYADIGEYQKAIDSYTEAQAIWQKLKDSRGEGRVLNNLGLAYTGLHQPAKAIGYYKRAANLAPPSDARAQSYLLQNLGDAYAESKQYAAALDDYNKSLQLKRTSGDRFGQAYTLTRMGEVQVALGDPQKAIASLNEALDLNRFCGARSGEASSLAALARANMALGKLDNARLDMKSAIAIIEDLRTELSNRDLRTTYFAGQQSYYAFYIDLLMRLHRMHPEAGYDGQALEVSEQSRARTLLESLGNNRSAIRSGVDAHDLEREQTARNDLHAKAERLETLTSGHPNDTELARARKGFDDAMAHYDEIQAEIRTASPRYAALVRPEPLSVADIQHGVLDSGTLLLEYSLGAERSYGWLVSNGSIRTAVLPARGRIEQLVHRLYKTLDARNETSHDDTIESRNLRILAADAAYNRVAKELGAILFGPFQARLGTRRLVIVPDGPLHYVPFSALPLPSTGKPLVARNEVVRLPSASIIDVLRRDAANRPHSNAIAIVADPVFDSDDPRLHRHQSDRAMFVTAKAPSEPVDFPRLRFSRVEGDEIASLAPHGKVQLIRDFNADRDVFLRGALRDDRILHIATHTVIDNDHPALSKIVLSRVDERGRARDGYLRLYEIYNLNLHADLVVLSACRTALGTEIRGEGLVGLTRAFLYAGASRVVASLWSVQDKATAELMRHFYTHLLTDGMPAAAALHAAQLEMASDPRWSNPYYWAAFTLQGDWK